MATKKSIQTGFSRIRIIKNLTVITCAFVLLFTAYDGLSMLQSTMNKKHGIGSASQAVVYLTFAVSSLLLPKYTIKKLGCKMTMFVGTLSYLPYIIANAYPTWFTMISSAILIGMGAGILWASQCTYFNEVAGIYCGLVEDSKKGKKRASSNSGVRNLELFVIQNGINEKMASKLGLMSDGIIITQECRGICPRDTRAESKCSTVEAIAENNTFPKLNENNLPIGKDKERVMGEENNKKLPNNGTILKSVPSMPITTENSNFENSKNELKTENTISLVEDKTLKKSLAETEKSFSHDMIINNQIPEKTNSISYSHESSTFNNVSNVEKRTSSISQSLKDIVINVTDSKFCTIESVTARFFGCFASMYCMAQVWSNLLSYYVLNVNIEDNITLSTNQFCGAQYCNFKSEIVNNSNTSEISSSTRYLLIGITVALSVVSSLLVLIFLDNLDTREDDEKVTFTLKHAMATFNHLKKKEQLFIVPLSMFLGMAQGFYTADFTKSYIQCAWSISYVGLVSVFLGIGGGISSIMSGCVVKYVGRIPVVLLGLTLHLGLDAFLLMWHPNGENPYMFHMMAALYGAEIGLFWSQLQAFYGLLFKNNEEAAFATNSFCSAIGWTLSFAYSDYLCTSVKIYILMAFACSGVLGYLLADRSFGQRNKS